MKKPYSIFILITAATVLTCCSSYRKLYPKNKTISTQELSSLIKAGRHYKIWMQDSTTAFITVKKIEGTMISGKMRSVNNKYYPIRDSNGEVIVNPMGSLNLGDARSVKKRKSMLVLVVIPAAISIGLFVALISLGPYSGE